jgi:hypothetical protein
VLKPVNVNVTVRAGPQIYERGIPSMPVTTVLIFSMRLAGR